MATAAEQPLLVHAASVEIEDEDDEGSSSSEDQDDDAEDEEAQPSESSIRATGNWMKAKNVIGAHVRAKQGAEKLLAGARATQEDKKRKAIIFLVVVVGLSVAETETKAAAFHMSAVGLYSDRIGGKPYAFKYTMFVTLTVFLMKLGLGPLHSMLGKKDHKKHKGQSGSTPKAKRSWPNSWKAFSDLTMPWVLLIGFTFLEMVSTSLANFGLTMTPTSIFVVCKTSKILFVAVMAVALGMSKLRLAQWAGMLMLTAALGIAAVAEGKPPKAGAPSIPLLQAFLGPIILVLSELVHATMLISQQIAMERYWHDGIQLVSWSAAVGIPMTVMSMIAAGTKNQAAPPYEPVNDTQDVLVMCFNNPVLGIALVSNLIFHVAMDVSHILCLKYMSSLARSLSDAIKLAVMWILGKTFWFTGWAIYRAAWPAKGSTLAVLAEPVEPKSWMMIPALGIITYALLMYKFRVFLPVRYVKKEDGTYHWTVVEAKNDKDEDEDAFRLLDTGMDDGFYANAFHNRKIRSILRKRFARTMKEHIANKVNAGGKLNKWQKAGMKMETHPE